MLKRFEILLLFIYIVPQCLGGLFKKEPKSLFGLICEDSRFEQLAKEIVHYGLETHFESIEAGTVFAPANEGFGKMKSKEQVLYHVVPVAMDPGQLSDGLRLKTEAVAHGLPQYLKVAKATLTRQITIGSGLESNQAKVIGSNIEASNGQLYAIDRLLELPESLENTLGSEDTLDEFKELLDKTEGALEKDHAYTIFATQTVFGDQMSEIEKRYLNSRDGRHDLSRLLAHQMTRGALYLSELKDGRSKLSTLEGSEELDVIVDGSSVTVNGVKVVKTDLLASNGVIHVLESPLLPKQNFVHLTPRKVLYAIGANQFLRLLDKHGLGHLLDQNQTALTILAPSDDGLEYKHVPGDDMKRWLQYHLVQGYYPLHTLVEGQLLKTESVLAKHQEQQRIRVKINGDQVQLGASNVLSETSVNRHMVYAVSVSLKLPLDPLNLLPVHMDLSTFVAALHTSGLDQTIAEAQGITLFVPSNAAFARLGLVAQHLLQPGSRQQLAKVVQYHLVHGVYYSNETKPGKHDLESFLGETLVLNKTEDGLFVRGQGASDGEDRSVIGRVETQDILASTGVIHTLDRVQLPSAIKVSNQDLVSLEGTREILELLKQSELSHRVLDGDYTLLAPSDSAMAKIDLAKLKSDPEGLLRFLQLHVLPVSLPVLDLAEVNAIPVGYTGQKFPTLLKDTQVFIRKNVAGGYSVQPEGNPLSTADISNLGLSSQGGGVFKIDRVLELQIISKSGWRWWQIALAILGSVLGLLLITIALYFLWGWYKSQRGGQLRLDRD